MKNEHDVARADEVRADEVRADEVRADEVRPDAPRRVSLWLLALIAVGVAVWVAPGAAARASVGGRVTADEPQYLLTAISLGEDHDLDVRDERLEHRYRDFHRAQLPLQEKIRDDDRLVSPHDPLLPAVLAMPMLVGGWVAGKLTLAAIAGVLAATLLWTAVVRFGVPTRAAVLTVLAFSAGAPLAMYGTQVYPELPAALAVALAIALLTGPLDARHALGLSACVVALPWLSVKYVPVAIALVGVACFAFWGARDRRLLLWLGGACAVAGIAYLAAHQAWYGGWTPYASGGHFIGGEMTVVGTRPDYVGRAVRLVGLLVDRDFGLVAWNPAYLLMVPALAALVHRRPPRWPVLVVPLLAGWLNATFVALTMHGWWWPGRQVVVVLPCAVLAVAWWVGSLPVAQRALAVLGCIGAFVFMWLVIEASVFDLALVASMEQMANPFVRVWRTLLPDYRDGTTSDWALHGAWLLALTATVMAVARPQFSTFRTRSVRAREA
jgi:hypothetical protein